MRPEAEVLLRSVLERASSNAGRGRGLTIAGHQLEWIATRDDLVRALRLLVAEDEEHGFRTPQAREGGRDGPAAQ